jgi:hypothetical protein
LKTNSGLNLTATGMAKSALTLTDTVYGAVDTFVNNSQAAPLAICQIAVAISQALSRLL